MTPRCLPWLVYPFVVTTSFALAVAPTAVRLLVVRILALARRPLLADGHRSYPNCVCGVCV
eukprot:13243496-Alexandrium_andersonii.AAC.1